MEEDGDEPNLDDAFRHMSRILRVFYGGGGDRLCRGRKQVNNRVVGRAPNARQMLNYLITEGILDTAPRIYCLNKDKLAALGITWENINKREVPDKAREFLAAFVNSL